MPAPLRPSWLLPKPTARRSSGSNSPDVSRSCLLYMSDQNATLFSVFGNGPPNVDWGYWTGFCSGQQIATSFYKASDIGSGIEILLPPLSSQQKCRSHEGRTEARRRCENGSQNGYEH